MRLGQLAGNFGGIGNFREQAIKRFGHQRLGAAALDRAGQFQAQMPFGIEPQGHPRPRRAVARVVVFRRDYAVYRRTMSRSAFALVADLAAGRSVGPAVGAALRRREAPDSESLARWFRQWAAEGLFARVVVDASS